MKYISLSFVLLLISSWSYAQDNGTANTKFISVTGSAEVIVSPDEIELEIVLKEYTAVNGTKIELSIIESKFKDILESNNIDQRNVIFGDSDYYWYYWWNYRNDRYKQKKYKVKLNSDTKILAFVQTLDIEGVSTLRISNTSNKELQRLRKEIKIAAMQAAKEKAKYLLESIDEKLGQVISIVELPDNQNRHWLRNQNLLSNFSVGTTSSADDIENVAPIKLRYELKAKFEIL